MRARASEVRYTQQIKRTAMSRLAASELWSYLAVLKLFMLFYSCSIHVVEVEVVF